MIIRAYGLALLAGGIVMLLAGYTTMVYSGQTPAVLLPGFLGTFMGFCLYAGSRLVLDDV